MAADVSLAEVRADTRHLAPQLPGLDEVIEDAGRQRLAAYYLYSALLAGVIGADDLAPKRWPAELAEPMHRLDLIRFAPRTRRGLDAQLTAAEQATGRNPDRQFEFAQLLVDLINKGAFGPICGDADRVRLAGPRDRRGLDLELIKGRRVVATCEVKAHWELVAQRLAGAPLGDPLPETPSARRSERTVARRLKESGIAHAVSLGTTLAVQIHPLGAVAGLGAKLVRSRIQAGRDQADALRRVGQDLRTMRAQAEGELNDLRPGRST
jgi:hypothetical protein